MDIKKELKLILVKEEISLTEVAQRLSAKKGKTISVQSVFNKLARNSLKVNDLIDICDVLDYEIEIKKRK